MKVGPPRGVPKMTPKEVPPTPAPAPHLPTPPSPKKALSAPLQPGKQLQSHVGGSSNPHVRAGIDGAANSDAFAEKQELNNNADKPDLELLRKVEEIKQLQCAISMNANLALKLSMEVMGVVVKNSKG
ncbi:hypothetical protein JVT61DRAFT_1497 [Boletus reticuloceps]|uniref:Uncharacterized protein n=1 Tax=Boletus reticuloceps TaxID=495285 RepID=A0A8I3A212_9AGAM|nr:hypothetical protein JVT61DRAFT_1497 [Boletus reticuloceps]